MRRQAHKPGRENLNQPILSSRTGRNMLNTGEFFSRSFVPAGLFKIFAIHYQLKAIIYLKYKIV